MQQYDISTKATETAINSQGSAMRENAEYMKSLEARIQQMKTAWETLSLTMGDKVISNAIVGFTSIITGLTNVLSFAVEKFGALPTVFGIVHMGVTLLSASFRAFTVNLAQTVAGVFGIVPATAAAATGFKGLSATLKGLSASAKMAGISIKSLLVSTGVGLAFVALGFVVEKLIGLFGKATESQQEYFDNLQQNVSDSNDRITTLENLSKQIGDHTKSQEELNSIYEQTKSIIPEIVDHYTSEGNAVYKTKEQIDQLIKAEKELNNERKRSLYNAESDTLEETGKEIAKEKKSIKSNQDDYKFASAKYEALEFAQKFMKDNNFEQLDSFSDEYISKWTQLNNEVKKIFSEKGLYVEDNFVALQQVNNDGIDNAVTQARDELNKVSSVFDTANNKIKEDTKKFADHFKSYNDIILAESDTTDKNTKIFLDKLSDSFASSANITKDNAKKVIFEYEDFSKSINKYITDNNIDLSKIFESGNSSNFIDSLKQEFPQYTKQIDDLGKSLTQTTSSAKQMFPVYDELGNQIGEIASEASEAAQKFTGLTAQFDEDGALVSFTGKIKDFSSVLEKLVNQTTQTKTEVELLTKAQKELSENNYLSVETIAKLNSSYKDFIKVSGLGKDAIYNFIKAKKEEKIAFVDAELQKTKELIEATKDRIAAMKEEYDETVKLLSTRVENGDLQAEKILINQKNGINKESSLLDELTAKYGIYRSMKSEIIDATKIEDKKQKSNNDTLSETNELLTEQQKRLRAIEEDLNNLQNKRNRLKRGSEEYRKSLQEEIKLLKEQKKIYDAGIRNPSTLVSTKVTSTSKTSGTFSSSSPGTVSNMLNEATNLQGKFKYKQISGEFKGSYGQFVDRALSDCSQFVQEMFKEFLDIKLPRTAAQQAKQGTSVSKEDLQPGDLVFFNTTGKNNSHVGIYMGDSKFIQMGNSGLNTQNLNSSYWAPKYQGARRITETDVPTVSTTKNKNTKNRTKAPSQSDLESAAAEAKQKSSDLNAQIYDLTIQIVEDSITESENKISALDNKISLSQGKQSLLPSTSAAWRKEEMNQSSYLQAQQKEIEKQNIKLNQLLKENSITSGEFDQKLAENSAKWWDYQQQIAEKRYAVIQSTLDEYKQMLDDVAAQLDDSSSRMSILAKGAKEYNTELQNQIPLLREQQKIHQNAIDVLKKQLVSDKLTADQKVELVSILRQEEQAWWDNESAIKANVEQLEELRETAVDNIIDELKKAIEQERDLKLDAIDQQREAEEKRHKERTKNIDDEYAQFEKYINAQLKAIDRQSSAEDYEEELNKKLEERKKINDELNKWSMDKSMEGKAKTKELEDQLNQKNDEIEKFKTDRERELRKEGLQDQLDDRKEYIDKNKEIEDELTDSVKENLDKQQKAIEQEYKDRLGNEKYFYDLKQRLMSQDSSVVKSTIAEIKNEYGIYFTTLQSHAFTTNQAFENLNYTLQKSLENLKKYSDGDYSETPDYQTGYTPPSSPPSGGNGSSGNSEKMASWSKYLSNKKQAESIRIQMDKAKNDKAKYKQLESSFNSLAQQNETLRMRYGFPDGSYDQLKNMKIYHQGGEVGVEGTTTDKWWKKFLKTDEVPAILKKGEVVLDNPLKFINGIVDKLSSGITNTNIKSLSPTPAPVSNPGSGNVNIEKVIIQANDKDTSNSLLNKWELALKKATKNGALN